MPNARRPILHVGWPRLRKKKSLLFEVEESLIHMSQAEVGAYLLSLWGLPYTIVEAVAHPHHPRRIPNIGFDVPLGVCVANILT